MEECRFPPPLTDDQLEAAIDGTADSAVMQHLQACPYCTVGLAGIQNFENALSAALHRWDCPKTQELGEYFLGIVPDERRVSITEHLERCLRCRDELAEIRRFVDEDTRLPLNQSKRNPTSPGKRSGLLSELIGALVPLHPATVRGLRGSEKAPTVHARVMGIDIFLSLETSARGIPILRGGIFAKEMDEWVGALIELWQQDNLQATLIVNENNNFRYEGFQPAYPIDLRINAPNGRMLALNDVQFPGVSSGEDV